MMSCCQNCIYKFIWTYNPIKYSAVLFSSISQKWNTKQGVTEQIFNNNTSILFFGEIEIKTIFTCQVESAQMNLSPILKTVLCVHKYVRAFDMFIFHKFIWYSVVAKLLLIFIKNPQIIFQQRVLSFVLCFYCHRLTMKVPTLSLIRIRLKW